MGSDVSYVIWPGLSHFSAGPGSRGACCRRLEDGEKLAKSCDSRKSLIPIVIANFWHRLCSSGGDVVASASSV